MAGQVLRMHANGRLTTPPQLEAVLVTNSACGISLQDAFTRAGALGTTLDISSLGTGSPFRTLRTAGRARSGGRNPGKFDPVSAAQVLSAFRGFASGS